MKIKRNIIQKGNMSLLPPKMEENIEILEEKLECVGELAELYFPGGCASRGVYRRDLFTGKVQRPGFPFLFLYAGARIGAA